MEIYSANSNHIIGDGKGTNLWTNNWIQKSPLRSLLIGPLPHNALNKKVSSIILHNATVPSWNLNDLPFPLALKLKQKILNIVLPPNSTETPDFISWTLASNGAFSIKISYHWISTANFNVYNNIPSPNLKWIWHSPCNTKFFFLWQVFHEGLATSQALFNRNIIPSTNCSICTFHSETTLHILREYPLVKLTWTNFQLPNNFFSDDLKTWLKSNVRNLNSNKIDLPCSYIFSYTIRSIWLAINDLLFQNPQNNNTFNPLNIANITIGKSTEF